MIAPTASDEEADAALARLLYQAGLVRNPYYTLTDAPIPEELRNRSGAVDVAAIARDYIEALAAIPETASRSLNSYEIFVSEMTRHFLNSKGVEYTCTYPSSMVEVVVNARDEAHEIELYRMYHSGTCDRAALAKDISRVMSYGEDRLRAEPMPKLRGGDVVFSTQDALEIYRYFEDHMYADFIVRKMSDWEIGKPVAPEMIGDRVTLEAVSSLPNSSMNFPVDREGNVIRDRYLIRDGVAEQYCGSRQFSQYLGLAESSLLTNVRVAGGRFTEEAIRTGTTGETDPDYLEVVEFSDFQVDSISGDIAGEVRLGYLHRGGKVTVVTGGSVSGSMVDAVRDMVFSKETVQYDNYEIPSVTMLRDLRITGVE